MMMIIVIIIYMNKAMYRDTYPDAVFDRHVPCILAAAPKLLIRVKKKTTKYVVDSAVQCKVLDPHILFTKTSFHHEAGENGC